MRTIPLFLTASAFALMGCKEDPNEQANALFVDAMRDWASYETLSENDVLLYSERLALLNSVDQKLTAITDDYPASDLAVQLSAKGQAEGFSHTVVQEILSSDLPEQAACVDNLRQCVLISAQVASQEIENTDERSAFETILRIAGGETEIDLNGLDGPNRTYIHVILVSERAKVFKRQGDTEAASASFTEAINFAASSPESTSVRIRLLSEVAQISAAVDDIESAVKALDTASGLIVDDADKANYTEIATTYAKIGEIVAAQEAVQNIPANKSSDFAVRTIVDAQILAGDLDGALRSASGIKEGTYRSSALRSVAKGYGERNDYSHADEITSALVDAMAQYNSGYKFAETRVDTMVALAALDNDEAALELSKEVGTSTEALLGLMTVHHLMGNDDEARKALNTARRGEIGNDRGLGKVVETQAIQGDYIGAYETLTLIEEAFPKANAALKILEHQSANGRGAKVADTALTLLSVSDDIEDPSKKASVRYQMLQYVE